MSNKNIIINILEEQGLLPLFFNADKEVSAIIIKALYDGGVRLVEYTNRGKEALDNFIHLKKLAASAMPDLYIGAGTIKTKAQAIDFINAGADYIVCPAMIEEIGETVHKHDLLWIPGCMTPTEIVRAEQSGASVIKLFPGNLLGPSFVSAIKELFPELIFVPTGGVEPDKINLQAWFNAGVSAVGMGSNLISKTIIEQKNYTAITDITRHTLSLIKEIKKQ